MLSSKNNLQQQQHKRAAEGQATQGEQKRNKDGNDKKEHAKKDTKDNHAMNDKKEKKGKDTHIAKSEE